MRLIDADNAKAELIRIAGDIHSLGSFFNGIRGGYQTAAYRLDTMPTVEERKQGHWITKKAWHVECSECHHVLEFICDVKNTARTAAQKWKVKNMELIDREALSMELANEVLCAYAKADFRLAKALNVFQFLIDKAPTVEERKNGHWIDIDLDTSICSVCKNPQEYETRYCPECGAIMDI